MSVNLRPLYIDHIITICSTYKYQYWPSLTVTSIAFVQLLNWSIFIFNRGGMEAFRQSIITGSHQLTTLIGHKLIWWCVVLCYNYLTYIIRCNYIICIIIFKSYRRWESRTVVSCVDDKSTTTCPIIIIIIISIIIIIIIIIIQMFCWLYCVCVRHLKI